MSAREDAFAGVKAVSPLILGIVPFALVAGITAVEAGFSPLQAVGMSVVVFAGASQLAAIELTGKTAPIAIVVLTALVVNLRFVMYSASIAPYFRRFDSRWKWLSAYVLTDQAYALSVAEYRESSPSERSRKWFYLGTACTLWVVWQFGTAVGALLGATIPNGLSLEFAVPLTFLALVFHSIEDRQTIVAAVVGAAVGVLANPLPFNLGLITGGLVGILAGTLVEYRAGEFPSELETDGGEDPPAHDDAHDAGGEH